MHKEVVDGNKWLTEQQFLNALSFCMLLPGPEAMQLATYAGWRLHGVLGGLIAGLLFVLPGAAIIMFLAGVYAIYGDVPLVSALFYGVKAAVLVIVLEALIKVSKKALGEKAHWIIAALAFIGLFFLSPVFFNACSCNIWWCICCSSLYGTRCCYAIWLAYSRRNDRCTWPCRNNAWATYSSNTICRLSCRLQGRRLLVSHICSSSCSMDDLRTMLSLDIHWRAIS